MTPVLWATLPLLVVLGQHAAVRPVDVSTAAQVPAADLYHQAVDLYRARNYPAAFETIKQLPHGQIDAAISAIERERAAAAKNMAPSGLDWSRKEVLAAGLLHGDVTLMLAADDGQQFDDSLRFAVRVLRDADAAEPGSREKPGTWTRDWLRAAASLFLVYGLETPTTDVLHYAETLCPDDGPLLVTRGMLAEFEAAAAVPSTSYSKFGMGTAQDSRQKALTRAAEAYQHALRATPDSDNARVRLAHVDIALGRDDSAIPLLERARNSPYPMPAYLATLMLGDIRARQGNTSVAEALYGIAITRSKGAQSAYVALSMLQYGLGRQAEAAATLEAMYAQHRGAPVDDPWWSYEFGLPQQPKAVFDALRAEVRQ